MIELISVLATSPDGATCLGLIIFSRQASLARQAFLITPLGYSSVFKQTAFCAPNGGVIILIYISQ